MRVSRNQSVRHDSRRRTRTLVAAFLAGAVALTSAACSSDGGSSPAWRGGGDGDSKTSASATITTPAADAKDVPASTEIGFTVQDATNPAVELKDATGKAVEGKLNPDGKTWLPNGQLQYGTTYTATVTATGSDGKPTTATSTFTTMAKPANQVRVTSFLGDGAVVGVGMPLRLSFSRAIPEKYRADVQRRLMVQATPAQEGIWHWIKPTEVHYRPKTFWEANTKLSYKAQVGGLPMGEGWYGRSDLTVDLKVGSSVIMVVDNKTKQMTVTKDGKVIKTIPISLGKASTPSSSGTMVIIEKLKKTVFNTMDDPNPANRYITDIEYAQRMTWGGEFIHAAPWSVGDQGRRNVSHGCVNMSTANAAWLFNQTRVGDPITVKGTERKLQNGNGWTDWNMSWEEYVKGSAIPYEAPTDAPDTDPSGDPPSSPTA
ncbi:L,D-transpeptidase [Micromonospora sonneratiae]|uniref:Ig-like domain-containing protein n=1 Tax=Micromonospora sonneratiae TaxID=1184706 RepID=A0ABW3YBA3_9ACTN